MTTRNRPSAEEEEMLDQEVPVVPDNEEMNQAFLEGNYEVALEETVWKDVYRNYECKLCSFASLKKPRALGHVRTAHAQRTAGARRAAAAATAEKSPAGLLDHRGRPISSEG